MPVLENARRAGKSRLVWRFGRVACCVALAAGLCWPHALAAASDDSEVVSVQLLAEESSALESAGVITSSASADEAVATSDDAAPDGGLGSGQRDTALILDRYRMADAKGLEFLERFLAGEELPDEELLAIDVEALEAIDADLADEVARLQDKARESLAAGNKIDDSVEAGASSHDAPTAADEPSASTIGNAPTAGSTVTAPEMDRAPTDQAADGGRSAAGDMPVASSVASGASSALPDEPQYPAWSYEGDPSVAPRSYTVNLTTAKLIAVIGEPARQLAQEHDLYASVMIAQAILESGSGGSGLSQPPYFNLFGIKGSYKGESVTMATQEDDGSGSYYTIDAAFRSYPSYRESLADYAELLSGPYYAPARKAHAATYVEACDYLQGTYATSTSYSAALRGIIEAYDLTRYDDPLGYELVESRKAVVDLESGAVLAWGDEGVAAYADVLAREGQQEVAVEERGLVDLIMQASCNLGKPYVWGGAGPLGYDCSGLVQSSYASALGVVLPRTTYYQCLRGEDVDFKDLHMGDLLFFVDETGVAGHVGMYLGEGCYIESTTGGVQVTALEERMPTFAKRMLPTRAVARDTGLASVPRSTLSLMAYKSTSLSMSITPRERGE